MLVWFKRLDQHLDFAGLVSKQAFQASWMQLICSVAEKGGESFGALDNVERTDSIHEAGAVLHVRLRK